MYDDENWTTLAGDEAAEILETASPVDGKYETSATTTKVEKRSLPFYADTLLIRLTDPSWGNKKLAFYYLLNGTTLYRLGGESRLIHEVNATGALTLTDKNVLDYLRFFVFFVRSEEGPFIILEDLNNPALPTELDNRSRTTLEKFIRPATIESKTEQGTYLCNAIVFYSNALFTATFEVDSSGTIEMRKDRPVAADLPFIPNLPIA